MAFDLYLPGAESDHRLSRDFVIGSHFTEDTLDANYWAAGGTTAPAIVANTHGGVCGITPATADTNTSTLAYSSTLVRADAGPLIFDAKIEIQTAVTSTRLFVGLTDSTGDEMPISIDATTWDTIATDAVGWVYDTEATTDEWQIAGVANNTDAMTGEQASGFTPVAGTAEWMRIIVDTDGTAYFYRNGVPFRKLENAVTPTVLLTPAVVGERVDATNRVTHVDYLFCRAKTTTHT